MSRLTNNDRKFWFLTYAKVDWKPLRLVWSSGGPEKGSWKGGTMGHGIDMVAGELHESAFRRYCETEQQARYGKTFRLTFIGGTK